jgi:hypothetical protein
VSSDDAALEALAVALAPRLLREVRRLIEAESADDRALGVAALAEMGYVPGPDPEQIKADATREVEARYPKRKRRGL